MSPLDWLGTFLSAWEVSGAFPGVKSRAWEQWVLSDGGGVDWREEGWGLFEAVPALPVLAERPKHHPFSPQYGRAVLFFFFFLAVPVAHGISQDRASTTAVARAMAVANTGSSTTGSPGNSFTSLRFFSFWDMQCLHLPVPYWNLATRS